MSNLPLETPQLFQGTRINWEKYEIDWVEFVQPVYCGVVYGYCNGITIKKGQMERPDRPECLEARQVGDGYFFDMGDGIASLVKESNIRFVALLETAQSGVCTLPAPSTEALVSTEAPEPDKPRRGRPPKVRE